MLTIVAVAPPWPRLSEPLAASVAVWAASSESVHLERAAVGRGGGAELHLEVALVGAVLVVAGDRRRRAGTAPRARRSIERGPDVSTGASRRMPARASSAQSLQVLGGVDIGRAGEMRPPPPPARRPRRAGRARPRLPRARSRREHPPGEHDGVSRLAAVDGAHRAVCRRSCSSARGDHLGVMRGWSPSVITAASTSPSRARPVRSDAACPSSQLVADHRPPPPSSRPWPDLVGARAEHHAPRARSPARRASPPTACSSSGRPSQLGELLGAAEARARPRRPAPGRRSTHPALPAGRPARRATRSSCPPGSGPRTAAPPASARERLVAGRAPSGLSQTTRGRSATAAPSPPRAPPARLDPSRRRGSPPPSRGRCGGRGRGSARRARRRCACRPTSR